MRNNEGLLTILSDPSLVVEAVVPHQCSGVRLRPTKWVSDQPLVCSPPWPHAMLVGHYAAAFLIAAFVPSLPLHVLLTCTQLVDYGWSIFVLLGIEHLRLVPGITAVNALDLTFIPFTHSLLITPVWALMVGVAWTVLHSRLRLRKHSAKGRAHASVATEAVAVALATASHWMGDLVVHIPDLPLGLAVDTPRVGLGVWRNKTLSILLESGLVLICGLCWWRATRPRTTARLLFALGLTLFAVVSFFVPFPPTTAAIAVNAIALYVAVSVCAYFVVDRPT